MVVLNKSNKKMLGAVHNDSISLLFIKKYMQKGLKFFWTQLYDTYF